ncbi:hypothetical protein LPJ64_002502 [Coemansia asiatica]|uniref:Mediator of RNA polymerase II transcription subunit 23 n=1 Tax=Coemansia asiatica TaxID=1052880 RepID=A0A9W7XJJ9_9FUNG|nr:hypothetical protein LPJ64_002502 [Coemansia asiatica]
MEQLAQYLVGVIESSYQDLAHMVPCGSFLGLFDERPTKRSRVDGIMGLNAAGGWTQRPSPGLFEFDDSETTCRSIRELTLSAIKNGSPAVDTLRLVVDAVRNIHDGSAVVDIGFRALFEIYTSRLEYHCANRFQGQASAVGTFGEEYLILTVLFELHRPRTWVAAVRVMSLITKSAIGIMYGGGKSSDSESDSVLLRGTHAASLSEISGMNLLPESVCREAIRQVWRLLLDSAATEAQMSSVLASARRTRWQIRFEATMELFDSFVGRSEPCVGRPLVSYYVLARELDPGAAVAESGMLGASMQTIVDLCFGRKRRLGRILLPPDGSWPLISHASRAHTVKHVYDQAAYAVVRDSLTFEETERGPSANKYVADLLYQRAPTDEIFAAIRNHRITKKKAIAAVASGTYVPNSYNMSEKGGEIRDSAEIERYEVAALLLDAMAQRIEHVVRYIQRQCDFKTLLNERRLNDNSDTSMVVPRRFKYWEYMNEVADQLYYFVLFDAVPFKAVHDRLYSLVFPKDSDIHGGAARKDNAYIWLLLQLYHIEKVSSGPVREDLAGDEDMLDQLLQMYSEQQIVSRDAFYLRDLALQAAMSHQQANIRDNQGVKFRHPRMAVAMPFAPIVYRLQSEFGRQFKDERFELLQGRDVCSAMKTATVSMLRQYVVPNALYTFLVPAREDIKQLQNEETTYLEGGNVATMLLDHINVGGKHRLLQLVYKMMLAHELGPQFQIDGRQPSVRPGITCVSPHIVDTVYRLLYNAPYSNELMMKEVLEKLRRCDKVMATGNARFSAATLRWLHTVYQLMNCRLLRFFKYYAHAAHLVHHLRHSLVHVSHRQLYGSLECFALCLVNLQHDVEFLQALLDPAYHGIPLTPHPSALLRPQIRYTKPKDAWFECAMLARNAVSVIARIVHMRGLGDAPGLSLEDCLDSLAPERMAMVWAPSVLRYWPPRIRAYYASKHASRAAPVAATAVRQLLATAPGHAALRPAATDTGPEIEAALIAFYAERPRQPLFLLAVWEALRGHSTETPDAGLLRVAALVRRVLLQLPPSQMSSHTTTLVDFVLGSGTVDAEACALLDAFMFRLHLVRHEHVVFALTRGEHDLRGDHARLALARYVLLESPGFTERLSEWHRLDFQGRYWADYKQWEKQSAYLARFPEFFEYDGLLRNAEAPLDPPPAMSLPIYYENGMVRLLPVLEFALGRLIEAEDRVLLRDVLDRMGILYRLHQVPLTTLMNTLFVYFDAPPLHDAAVIRSLNLSLLDMTQQDFSPEFCSFVRGQGTDLPPEGPGYIARMMARISRAVARHLPDPLNDTLPEIHYREIPNPILLVLTECVVELLTWWCLHCAPASSARLAATPRPASEQAFREEERSRAARASEWPMAHTWFALAMDPPSEIQDLQVPGATHIHSTGVLANVMPDELMAFPFVRHLREIVLEEPVLQTVSGPKDYFSFVAFAREASSASTDRIARHAAGTKFAATAVFNSFEQNRIHGNANRPNTYLTLLHSILHYGGVATFAALADTIRGLAASGALCSDIQLLYLCATVGPVLYRLVEHEPLYVQVLADLIAVMAQICPRISHLNDEFSTDAIEQVMDFFCFVKDQFDPGRQAWRRIAPHIAALPASLRYQLQCIVDQ